MFLFGDAKRILSLMMSALVALPAGAWAKDVAPSSLPSAADVPVFVETVRFRDGRQAQFLLQVIPAAQEQLTLGQVLARANSERLMIGVAGTGDPAYAQVARSGKDVAVYGFHQPLKQTALARFAGQGARGRDQALARIKRVSDYAARNHAAILCSIFYGGVVGGYSAFISSSVTTGAEIMVPLTAWNIFASTTSKWERAIEFFAEGSANAFEMSAELMGHEMSPSSARHAASFGKFMSTFVASAGGVALMVGVAGHQMTVTEFVFDSALFNYGVWDPTIFRKVQEGKIESKWISRYFSLQFVGGAFAEASTYAGYHEAQYILTANLAVGLSWMFAGEKIESFLGQASSNVKLTKQTAKASLRKGFARIKKQITCAIDLGAPINIAGNRSAYQDTW